MNVDLDDIMKSDDENPEPEVQQRPIAAAAKPTATDTTLKNELKALFKSQLARKTKDLKKNPFCDSYGICMERESNLILQVMVRASETNDELIDYEWFQRIIDDICTTAEQREDLQYCRNDIVSLARNAVNEADAKMQHYKNQNELLRRYRRTIKVDEIDRRPRSKSQSFYGREYGRHSYKRSRSHDDFAMRHKFMKNESPKKAPYEDEEPDIYYNNQDQQIEDIFSKSSSPPKSSEQTKEGEQTVEDYDQPGEDVAARSIVFDTDRTKISREPKLTGRQQIIQKIGYGTEYWERHQLSDSTSNNTPGTSKKAVNVNCQSKANRQAQKQDRRQLEVENHSASAQKQGDAITLSSSTSSQNTFSVSSGIASRETITVRSSSSSVQIVGTGSNTNFVPQKSALKQRNANQIAIKRVEFTQDTDPGEEREPNPEYTRQQSATVVRLTTTEFTTTHNVLSSMENLQISDRESNSSLYKSVPSSDLPIKIVIRKEPENQTRSEEIPQIRKEFLDILKSNRYSRLLIADSIMKPLKEEIFRNMKILHYRYPRMPNWFFDVLEAWWKDGLNAEDEDYPTFNYTKVFIILGMDLILYYAHPEAKHADVIFEFLVKLNNWFETKLATIERNRGDNKYMKTNCITDDKGEFEQTFYLLNNMPIFILITIPEIGDWKQFFKCYNKRLREFVNKNRQNFQLLDWAMILEELEGTHKTVEERMAILIRQMYLEHTVLYV